MILIEQPIKMIYELELYTHCSDSERIVYGDSYFASVEAAEALLSKNLRFFSVIKTATRRFPRAYFGFQLLLRKVDFGALQSELHHRNKTTPIVGVFWLDHNRRHFSQWLVIGSALYPKTGKVAPE